MNDHSRIDFSSLDPTRDATPFSKHVAALMSDINAAGGPGPRSVFADDGFLAQLSAWLNPALAIALPVAAAAAIVLATAQPAKGSAAAAAANVATATSSDVLSKVAEWSDQGSSPSPLELLATIGGAGARPAAAKP
jgi:hypothetical protein